MFLFHYSSFFLWVLKCMHFCFWPAAVGELSLLLAARPFTAAVDAECAPTNSQYCCCIHRLFILVCIERNYSWCCFHVFGYFICSFRQHEGSFCLQFKAAVPFVTVRMFVGLGVTPSTGHLCDVTLSPSNTRPRISWLFGCTRSLVVKAAGTVSCCYNSCCKLRACLVCVCVCVALTAGHSPACATAHVTIDLSCTTKYALIEENTIYHRQFCCFSGRFFLALDVY